ncbi:META domain-containing protein [Streptomyces sp. NPDC051322]|uniref:META domain-containing protein n=1 Tax=Streptomyces sp. NPDC051322 TaxID=3154645 RepID=UPI00344F4E10
MHTQRTAVAALALLTLAACGTTHSGNGSSSSVAPDVPLAGTDWRVDSVTVDGRTVPVPHGADVSFDQGRVSGYSGCNHFSAPATVKGDTLTVGDSTSTLIGCPKNIQAYEKALLKTFSGKLTAKLQDGKLTLQAAGGDSVVLRSQRAAPLTGTDWKVTSLVEDGTASSLPTGPAGKARMTFGKDGSVHGNLGCNRFSGMAKVTDGTLTFGRLTTTRMACPGPAMTVERHLLKLLHGPVRYEIQQHTLKLRAADGRGIDATA